MFILFPLSVDLQEKLCYVRAKMNLCSRMDRTGCKRQKLVRNAGLLGMNGGTLPGDCNLMIETDIGICAKRMKPVLPGGRFFSQLDKPIDGMTKRIHLQNVAIVLNHPRIPENIGAAARAMRNMGIRRLIVVDPENFDINRVLKMATHAASDVVKSIESYETLKEALSTFNYVVGTTARLGNKRGGVKSPSRMAEDLIPISVENRIALVFGPEDTGLTNEDLQLCHALINIPTDEFSSLNLAQAVMIVCYELFNAGLKESKPHFPRWASRFELDGMYDQLRDILVRISYINPENPDYWMGKIRDYFNRIHLRAREVSIIRGICRQVDWYAEKRYRDGLMKNEKEGKQ